jgi:hypothetical protein
VALKSSTGFSYWTLVISAALLVVIALGVVMMAGQYHDLKSEAAPTTATELTPAWALSLPFNCQGGASLRVAPAPQPVFVDAVHTANLPGYDRVTIQFANGQPALTNVTTQHGTTFSAGAGGQTVTVNGNDGVLLTLSSGDGHTDYSGPTDLKTDYPILLELRQVQDFEGTLQWAIGLSRPPCYRMFYLSDPARLVIDFQAG